ncbi:glycosyltransferase family 2 protein [Polaribacter sp. R77954]|uniref:glycosyltransferase family 2 protein n=1 Tax=Polaribacter sp. R77954 TaxID=3093870 RepID=UPI0037C79359
MLSVLIPTYNYNALALVLAIHKQLMHAKIDFEIICFDDGSKSEINIQNNKINNLQNSKFVALDKNIGRSAIRNLLVKNANFSWLLFLDADVKPKNNYFISNYMAFFTKKNAVVCGGLLYENTKKNKSFLRYKYGKKKEEITVDVRQKHPNKYFFTSNFLIRKSVFNEVVFEEALKSYGREDSLFSIQLKQKGYHIAHIENEVYHLGIDENKTFILKTKKAIKNLFILQKNNLITDNDTDLLKLTEVLYTFKLQKLVGLFYPFFEYLTFKFTSVFALNLLKVSYFCYLKSKDHK